jgi:hypothetical protein
MTDLNEYKQNPFELTKDLLEDMTLKQSFEMVDYIQNIAQVLANELKIHSENVKKISEFMQKGLEPKKVH